MQHWVFFSSSIVKYMVLICKYSKQLKRVNIFCLLHSGFFNWWISVVPKLCFSFLKCQVELKNSHSAHIPSDADTASLGTTRWKLCSMVSVCFSSQFLHGFISWEFLFSHVATYYFYITSVISNLREGKSSQHVLSLPPW